MRTCEMDNRLIATTDGAIGSTPSRPHESTHPPTHPHGRTIPPHPTPPRRPHAGITPCFAQSVFALGPVLFFLLAGTPPPQKKHTHMKSPIQSTQSFSVVNPPLLTPHTHTHMHARSALPIPRPPAPRAVWGRGARGGCGGARGRGAGGGDARPVGLGQAGAHRRDGACRPWLARVRACGSVDHRFLMRAESLEHN